MTPAVLTVWAYLRARRRMATLTTRAALEAFQTRAIARFLRGAVPRVAAFEGARYGALTDAPYSDKQGMMADFASYNRLGMTAEQGWSVFEGRSAPPRGYAVGASTGTSGNRGLYLVSAPERYTWLGVMLSRAFPDLLTGRERVAVVLPQASPLYDTANESRRVTLWFFDLAEGIEARIAPLAAFAPTVIVAPPRVLRALAEADCGLQPEQVFSGGEVLDPADRAIIEAAFATRVREIYMATEGLFAVACRFGALHLVEDHVAVETLPVDGGAGRFNPVVTDFSRRTQVMLRYRMNDVVTFDDRACACGSVHRCLATIAGRLDDAFCLPRADGTMITLTPDVIRNAVVDSDRRITDFRVVQTAPALVRLVLPIAQAQALPAATAALGALFSKAGAEVVIAAEARRLDADGLRKLRRVCVAFETGAP